MVAAPVSALRPGTPVASVLGQTTASSVPPADLRAGGRTSAGPTHQDWQSPVPTPVREWTNPPRAR
jgi:hypothetical protein